MPVHIKVYVRVCRSWIQVCNCNCALLKKCSRILTNDTTGKYPIWRLQPFRNSDKEKRLTKELTINHLDRRMKPRLECWLRKVETGICLIMTALNKTHTHTHPHTNVYIARTYTDTDTDTNTYAHKHTQTKRAGRGGLTVERLCTMSVCLCPCVWIESDINHWHTWQGSKFFPS